MDPLTTRHLPNALWAKVPAWLVEADTRAQDWAQAQVDLNVFPANFLSWLTETPKGLSLLVILGLLYFSIHYLYRVVPYAHSEHKVTSVDLLFLVGGTLVTLVSSDLLVGQLKQYFGRLKPHVIFYNPVVQPALSMPSGHAFNSAVIFSFLYFRIFASEREQWRRPFFVLFCVVFLIGVSRVFFGQHYPLDVVAGWAGGFYFGFLMARVTNLIFNFLSEKFEL